ncbi:MAG: glycosyltransferase family 2 protein [Endozoicomonas sp. (ex Botrylloides leachii)]|nr:glycosyltransferase family 2 protein [Endozoicomonas sp. (ex Botrylloides leachii)]
MGDKPCLISIVIPSYNYAHYLPRTLNSVLSQCYAHYEVIIVDDGSTDNTEFVVNNIIGSTNKLCRYYRHTSNQGVSSARNTGIAHAKGDYIYFLDSDDELIEGALMIFAEAIKAEPSAGMLIAQYFSVHSNGQKKIRCLWPLSQSKEDNFKRYLLNIDNSLLCSSIVFKRDLLADEAFPKHLRLYEDEPVFSHMLANHPAVKINKPVVLVHKHSGSLRYDVHHNIVEASVNETFNRNRLSEKLMRYREPYLGLKHLDQFRTLFLAGQYEHALTQYAKGFAYNKKAALTPTFLRKAIKSWLRK